MADNTNPLWGTNFTSNPASWLGTFGKWCGPGWSAGARTTAAVLTQAQKDVLPTQINNVDSQVDAACKRHDINYSDASGLPGEKMLILQADVKLMQELAAMNWSAMSIAEKSFASLMAAAFYYKVGYDALVVGAEAVGLVAAANAAKSAILGAGNGPAGNSYTDPNGDVFDCTADPITGTLTFNCSKTLENGSKVESKYDTTTSAVDIKTTSADNTTVSFDRDRDGDGLIEYSRTQIDSTLDGIIDELSISMHTVIDGGPYTGQEGSTSTSTWTANFGTSAWSENPVAGVIFASAGANYVKGSAGIDTSYGAGGNDLVEGGGSGDYLWGDGVLTPNSAYYVAAANHGNDYLDGGEGNDQLIGQGGNDALFGGAGDDTLLGDDITEAYLPGTSHGTDYLDGGEGSDVMLGGGGNDALYGGAGADNLMGDAGRIDLAGAYHGIDFLDGGDGADTVAGSGKGDRLFGGGGDDLMYGDSGANPLFNIEGEFHGADFLDGGAGNDFMFGDGLSDNLIGGAGDDVMYGDNLTSIVGGTFHGNDNLDGGDGFDTLYGGGGNDVLAGGSGNDVLQGDDQQGELAGLFHGNDNLDGGSGNDSLYGQGGNDNLSGSDGNDLLVGDGALIDVPGQFHGNDTLNGGGGDDQLVGGGGIDTLYGGDGNDTLRGDGDELSLPLFWHTDDYLDGGDGFDVLFGGGGADTLLGGAGGDQLQGGDGDDTLNGGSGNDILFGEAGNNLLDGGDGNDNLYGGPGNDLLLGGAGNDQLSRQGGDDTMDGGAGNDTLLSNGAGSAVVMFGRGDGRDVLYWNPSDGGTTVLQLKEGVSASDLVTYRKNYSEVSSSLVVGIVGTTDFIEISAYPFPDIPPSGVSSAPVVKLANGAVWTPPLASLGTYENNLTNGQYVVNGASTNDLLVVKSSVVQNTQINAGGGDDVLMSANEPGAANRIVLYGEDGNDTLFGGIGGPDLLYGGAGDDLLDSGTGGDVLYGESGSNTYVFSRGDGLTRINAQRPTGEIATQTLLLSGLSPSDVEIRRVATTYQSDVIDSPFSDDLELRIIGTGDVLRITGFFLPNGHGGLDFSIDRVQFDGGLSWNAAQIQENLIAADVTSAARQFDTLITGGTGNDVMTGTSGADSFIDSLGNDAMVGGLGDDNYFMRDPGDTIVELANEGSDSVNTTVSWTLGANLETLYLWDAYVPDEINDPGTYHFVALNINGTGNALNNRLVGNGGDNVLNGLAGADTMEGGGGNDTYHVDNSGDRIEEYIAGNGIDTVVSSISYTFGNSLDYGVENLTLVGTANLNATGNFLANVLIGNVGNNRLDGKFGADTMIGGAGNDVYEVDTGDDMVIELAAQGTDTVNAVISYALGANIETLNLLDGIEATGNDGDNTLNGNDLDNVLSGLGGSDLLDGKAGADTMQGGAGNDAYTVDNLGDVVVELAGSGADSVSASVSYTLSAEVENLTLTGASALSGTGNAADNVLTGNSGANVLTGGAGNDTYVVGTGDTTIEITGGGIDTVQSSIAWTLAAEVENLTLTGFAAVAGTGNGLDNVLTGNSGINVLTGGAGNDTYVVGTGDTTIEVAGGGIDSVQSGVTWTLAAEVENLTLTGSAVINGTGNTLANVLSGNSAANTLTGLAGDDKYLFGLGGGADRVVDSAGADRIVFGAGVISAQVTATRAGSIVKLALNATDSVSIDDIGGGAFAVEQFEFADGSVLGAAWLNSILPSAAPTATNLSAAEAYTEDTARNLVDIVVADADSANTTVTLTLSNLAAGSFNTGTSGTVTSTFSAATGVWTASGAIASVNTLLAALTFTPTANFNGSFTLAASVSDGINAPVTGTKAFTGTKVNDVSTGAVTITGIAAQNQTLTANHTLADVDGMGAVAYQWKAAGVNIAGATASTFVLGSAQVGRVITVSASFTDGGGTAESKTSAASASVIANVTGTSGADTLNGTTGAELMIGLAGNDIYTVNNVGDLILENLNEGTDLVNASVSHTLAANVENITLTGSGAINATGNTLDNVLTGNSGANVLTGGAGNDTYFAGTGDTVVEALGGGIDTVQIGITHTLAANVENITLTGTTAINGTGNGLDNVLTGNSGVNVLAGGAGNDTYLVTAGDTTTEALNAGTDTVQSAVAWMLATNLENLLLTGTAAVNGTGNTGENALTGNSGVNTLTGNAGNDTLDGKAGADSLVGGTGNDTYWLGRGYGIDGITENDATAGNTDVARFEAGVATDQLWFAQVGNNLEVSIIGTSDKFNIVNWYTGNANHVEQFKTSDGKTLLDSQVQNLVSAMAAFAPPAAGQTTLPANYASTLAPVLAANWV